MTRECHVPLYAFLFGLCCEDTKLYCVERYREDRRCCLTVCDINGTLDGRLKALDRVEVRGADLHCRPRIDTISHRLYVPCETDGVRIFHCEGDLTAMGKLTCVKDARSVAVYKTNQVFVCDSATRSVYLVSVSQDRVMRRLDKPQQVGDTEPRHVSVLGETVLVCYGDNTLVTYRSDSSTSDQVLQTPKGLEEVSRQSDPFPRHGQCDGVSLRAGQGRESL